ncbi:MAG: serine hydrolase [Patescibacteria group bacterium]|jgi:D-alanyl-D-alanine carboxypeptidase
MVYYLIIGIVFFGQLFPPIIQGANGELVPSLNENNTVQLNVQESAVPADLLPEKISDSSGIYLTSSSALVMDKDTGKILFQKEPNRQHSIASVTKLMTALVFLEHNPGFDQVGQIGVGENGLEGSRVQVKSNDHMTVEDLFYASLVGSANNATQALVHATGMSGEEFVSEMNKKAASLGMGNTKYVEPTGLNPENVSTVADLAKLGKVAFAQPKISDATTRKEHSFITLDNKEFHKQISQNVLLDSYLNIKGAKTGFTYDAGYCMVAQAENENGNEVIVVVLGSYSSDTRFEEVKALTTWAFDNFEWSN